MTLPLFPMLSPYPAAAAEVTGLQTGTTYVPDAGGLIYVQLADRDTLLKAGYIDAPGNLLGRMLGANMNATTDQQIPLIRSSSPFRVTKITVKNASVSLTTAAGGIYTAASKGGTALVANTQVFTSLSSSSLALDLTIASTPGLTVLAAAAALFLSLTTAQGAAATADVYVWGDRYV